MSTYRDLTRDIDPLGIVGVFTDFLSYNTADWVITTTEAGAGSATETLSSAIAGGVLVVTNDSADDDADFFQYAGGSGAVVEPFKYVAGKRLRFVTRFKLSDATESDFVAGLQITDTTPLAVSDGIFFRKSDGDATLQLVICKNSTESVIDVTELADDTFVTAEFYYDGSALRAYVDGVLTVGATSTDMANVPDDEQLTLSFGIQNGAAASKVLSVDYIGAWQER